MRRAVLADVINGGVDTVDHSCRDDGVEVFGVPVLIGGGLHARIYLLHGGVAADFAAGVEQCAHHRREVARGTGRIDQ
jgi:hypothetical protein